MNRSRTVRGLRRHRAPNPGPAYVALFLDEPIPPEASGYNRFYWIANSGKLWREYRDQVVAQWAARHPGTRPAVWWLHNAGIGKPKRNETQAAFLRRLGLLTPNELERLNTADFQTQPRKRRKAKEASGNGNESD